jgi:hypothetical protein
VTHKLVVVRLPTTSIILKGMKKFHFSSWIFSAEFPNHFKSLLEGSGVVEVFELGKIRWASDPQQASRTSLEIWIVKLERSSIAYLNVSKVLAFTIGFCPSELFVAPDE